MYGGFDDDIMEGNAGNDIMNGYRGNDRLIGGDGNDGMFGLFDGDYLNSADFAVNNDNLDGGADTDSCISDPDIVVNCEST
jgi:Ca2+-binding RTX toxin-like protein